jgi:hypothetical protein
MAGRTFSFRQSLAGLGFNVALGAVTGCSKRFAAGGVAGSARGLAFNRRLVHVGFEVDGLDLLREQLRVTSSTFTLFRLYVCRMTERDIAVLRREYDRLVRRFVCRQQAQ